MATGSDFTDGAAVGLATCILLVVLTEAPQIAAAARWIWRLFRGR
jgi:hypothetical protein